MAVPAYATDLNDIYTDGGSWTTLAGRTTDPDTDDYIQGASCWSHDPFSSGIEGGVVNSAQTITAGDAVFIWTKADISPALATHVAGGIQALIGNASTALKAFYIRGSDDYIYGGWICIPVDPTKTQSTSIGTPTAVTDYFGIRWNVPGSGPSKGYPFKIDAIRHGKNLEVTAGEIANPASWDTVSAYDSANTRQWGICQPTNTGAALQGYIYWGTGAALVYSRDSNKTIVINDTEWTDTDFTQIIFAHASNDIVWDNVGLIALGTNNRGIIDVTANGAITWTNSVFQGIDTTALLAASTFDGSTWIGTNAITAGGASIVGGQILAPTVVANTSSLIWDVATDPDGLLDDMTFTKGAADHHAIEFGDTIPSEITIRNCDFTGFSASQDNNASVFHFKDIGGTITINLVNCTSDVSLTSSFRTDGATIIVVEDPVTTTVTTLTEDGTIVSDVRVIVEAKDNSGTLPFQESISITRDGTTATVTHTGHGIPDGKYVVIRGANEQRYNKVAVITWISANSYSYQVSDSPNQPATGSPIATGVMVYGATDGTGKVSDSRTLSSDQPVVGRTLKSTAGPYYKTGRVNGDVSSTSGANFTALMVLDQ